MKIYYTYAYLREDKTPYYIGKGKEDRAYSTRNRKVKPPTDISLILILKKGLTEEEAFQHEKYMIAVLGRKDIGTGILRNLTDGGEGTSGRIVTNEVRRVTSLKVSKSLIGNTRKKGKKESPETRRKKSISHTGTKSTGKTRKKISEALTGREFSDEHRKNLSKSKKGKTPESMKQVWESRIDGFQSTAAGVSHHNRNRGWDPKARFRVK